MISCIVPVYNGERYLGEALDSILAQTHTDLELIVVDDESTDGTAEVIASYGERVRALFQKNRGEAAARNAGIRAARGEYLAFLDADDLWLPDKLEHQLNRFREHPALELCLTAFRNFWVPELAEEERRYQGHPIAGLQTGYSMGTLMARRSAFEKFGLFGEGSIQNLIWLFGAKRRGAVMELLPRELMRRRFHGSNQSRTQSVRDDFLPILKAWKDLRH